MRLELLIRLFECRPLSVAVNRGMDESHAQYRDMREANDGLRKEEGGRTEGGKSRLNLAQRGLRTWHAMELS